MNRAEQKKRSRAAWEMEPLRSNLYIPPDLGPRGRLIVGGVVAVFAALIFAAWRCGWG